MSITRSHLYVAMVTMHDVEHRIRTVILDQVCATHRLDEVAIGLAAPELGDKIGPGLALMLEPKLGHRLDMLVFRTATVFTMTGRTTRMSHNKVSSFERNGSGEVPPLIDTIVSIKLQNDSIGSKTLQELVLKKSLNYRGFCEKTRQLSKSLEGFENESPPLRFLIFPLANPFLQTTYNHKIR